jgi:hypothetical protein
MRERLNCCCIFFRNLVFLGVILFGFGTRADVVKAPSGQLKVERATTILVAPLPSSDDLPW